MIVVTPTLFCRKKDYSVVSFTDSKIGHGQAVTIARRNHMQNQG